jgi:predicted nucleic acid-binding Zn ribbon protein
VKKLLSSPAIQFKGAGWYVTDYARKSEKTSSGEAKTDSGSKESSASTDAAGTSGSSAKESKDPAPETKKA